MVKVHYWNFPYNHQLSPGLVFEVMQAKEDVCKEVWQGKWKPANYVLAAEVQCNGLEDAFRLTNTIDSFWFAGNQVKALNDQKRSSSMGDIFEMDGKYYICARFGFEEIELT